MHRHFGEEFEERDIKIPENNEIANNALIPNGEQHQQTIACSRKVFDSKLFELFITYLASIKTTEVLELEMHILQYLKNGNSDG